MKNYLLLVLILGVLICSRLVIADPGTLLTIEDVGSIPSVDEPTVYNPTLDGIAGAIFVFLTSIKEDPDDLRTDYNGNICYRSAQCFFTDIAVIDMTSANSPGSFSSGFFHYGLDTAFATSGSMDADISYVSGSPVMTWSTASLPEEGVNVQLPLELYFPWSPGCLTDINPCVMLNVAPQNVNDPIVVSNCFFFADGIEIPLQIDWVIRDGTTADFLYKIKWSHCAITVQAPGGLADPHIILEGKMTVPDVSAPAVESVSGIDGAIANPYPSDRGITVTFTDQMDTTTIDTSSFTVSPTAGGLTECASITTTNDVSFTCEPMGGSFTANTSYNVNISTAVMDSMGGSGSNLNVSLAMTSPYVSTVSIGGSVPVASSSGCNLTVNGSTDNQNNTILTFTGFVLWLLFVKRRRIS